ncbi:MAG: protein-export chaperone SecB [Burkholderiaceae bacterium]|nr:MAG: protein-export chaperone SecB [Burkholderiaceae bacterium]
MSDQQPAFNIQRVYLRDQSLEIPHAPHIFLEQGNPTVEVQINVDNEKLHEQMYEVRVTATVTTKVGEKVAFLVEAKQGGIFQIAGVPEEQMEPLLGIVCPNIIYPYLRSNVADLVQRAGFPPIHLQEINFEAFYQQRLQEKQAAANGHAN